MGDLKSRILALTIVSSSITPLSHVNSQAAVVDAQPLSANEWAEMQMAKIKGQITLVEAFKRIEKLTGYRIMYSYDDVKNYKAQAVPTYKDIRKALSQVLGDLPLEYSINHKFVSITPKPQLASNVSLSPTVKEGMTVVLQGKVVDVNGDPLPGVTVQVVKDHKITTVTHTD
mgnify:FL=1